MEDDIKICDKNNNQKCVSQITVWGKMNIQLQLQQDENTEDAHTMADLPRFVTKSYFFAL